MVAVSDVRTTRTLALATCLVAATAAGFFTDFTSGGLLSNPSMRSYGISITDTEDGHKLVQCSMIGRGDGTNGQIERFHRARNVFVCAGRRLGSPREQQVKGETEFNGTVCSSIANDMDKVSYENADIIFMMRLKK